MNYKYIHPLYTEDDKQEAIDFLAKSMIDDTSIAFTNSEFDEKNIQQQNKEFMMNMTRNLIKTMYGVNIIDMANFRQVQDVFYDKYSSYIINYLNMLGYKAELIMFNPASITPFAMIKEVYNRDSKPLERYNPNEKWDFTVSDDIRKNIMNPVNGMDMVILHIKNVGVKMPLILKELYGKVDKECLNYEDLAIKILPSKNFESIQGLVKIINTVF